MGFADLTGQFLAGLNSAGMPLLGTYGNKIFWVHSGTGSDGYKGTFNKPLATIDEAIGHCTASKGDIIMVKPYHAETLAASITMDVIGVTIIGLGAGTAMPQITCGFVGDAITMTAAGCAVINLAFPACTIDAVTADINVAAGGCSIINTVHIGSGVSTYNKTSFITVTSAGHDLLMQGIRTYNVTTDVIVGVSLESTNARMRMVDCYIGGSFSTAALADTSTATLLYFDRCVFKNTKADTSVVTFSGNSTGSMRDCFIDGRHTTIATNLVEGTGMGFYETYVVEEPAKNALLEPAVDAE